MTVCDECGSRQVQPRHVEGAVLEECALCGHLHGDAEVISRLEERTSAHERGMHPLVYPLVESLELVPTFRISGASAGRPDTSEFPFVFLRLQPEGLRDLERLLTSLEMANRETQRRWVVECALQRGLLFILRPRFWKPVQEISADDIQACRADLDVLAKILRRDVRLSWWRD